MAGGRVEDGRRIVSWMRARLAMVTVAAVGIYIPTLGIPFPGSCMQPGPIASAGPSPTCSGDLRECLRQSADIRQTTFGGRYVTAEDVARCVEAFNACIHGTPGSGATPPASTGPTKETEAASLPRRFDLDHGGGAVSDCRVEGGSVTCTANWNTADDSFSATFTGTASGLSMNGTTTTHRVGHAPDNPGCVIEETYVGPVTYTFSAGGTVDFTAGPNQRQSTFSGSCPGSNSGTTVVMKGTAAWSPTR